MYRLLSLTKNVLFYLPVLCIYFPASAQWTAKAKVSANTMHIAFNENMGPCLAANAQTLHAVWSDRRTNGNAIYYSHSVDTGHNWSNPVPITDTNGIADFPAIAVSGSTVHVVWRDSTLGHYASFYKRSLDGGNTWSSNYCLDSNTLFWPGIAAYDSLVVVSLNGGTFGSTIVYFIRSLNSGANWDTIRTISTRTGPGRSEDPDVNTDGKNVFLSWNDNRSGKMDIYYRRSTDKGVTWDAEIPVATHGASGYCYTTMTSVNDSNVDLVYADDRSGNFQVYIKQSHNYGASFDTAMKQLTSGSNSGAYPYLVRSGNSLHLVYNGFGSGSSGPMYMHSPDGGATWTSPLQLGQGSQPFIALICPSLHVIWPDSNNIYYTRDPIGDTTCAPPIVHTNVPNVIAETNVKIFPNPAYNTINILFSQADNYSIELYSIAGNKIGNFICSAQKYSFTCGDLPEGLYFLKISSGKNIQVLKFVKQ